MALTWAAVKAAKEPGTYSDGGGLYLQVARGGSKSWILRYQLEGRRREMGLGSADDVSLSAARELAQEARKLIAKGQDPIAARKAVRAAQRLAEAQAVTFKQVAEAYIDGNEAGWKNAKHRQQWRNTLQKYAYPVLGSLPVAAIDTALVLEVLNPIWHKRPETASRVRGRIERVLSAAKVNGQRAGENPALWRGHLDHILPPKSKVRRVRHQPALPYAELPAFMRELRALNSISAQALEFTILTAVRTGQTTGATWPELNRKAALWTIPAVRMKGNRDHKVPLSDATLAIVERLYRARISPWVFPGWRNGSPLSDMAMLECLRGLRPGYTVHGFRSSFKDWCTEQTAYPDFLSEMALAHIEGDKTRAAYARAELVKMRREMMEAWAAFCGGA